MRKKGIVLVGGGGHCKVVIDAIELSGEFAIHGVTDLTLNKGMKVLNIRVLGKDDILPALFKEGTKQAFITIGSIGNCELRKKIYANLIRIGFELPFIVHPKAIVSKYAELSEGAFIAAGAVINAGTKIGKNAIINTSSSIDHDCEIGDFVHIAPGVTLSGGVRVGANSHIGTGAKVIQCLDIGKNVFIPAGSLVTKNMHDNENKIR